VSQRQIENTIPVLAVRDLERSIAFFRATLGFEVEWNAGVICSVARDGCGIMLQVQDEVHPGVVWIGLDGDDMFSVIQRSGAKILQPPSNKPWAYEMKIADPDGNVLWLGAEPKETEG
jgi:predicted enzyme related to lactoylglutathione lyase